MELKLRDVVEVSANHPTGQRQVADQIGGVFLESPVLVPASVEVFAVDVPACFFASPVGF